jgi:hypothetical protein
MTIIARTCSAWRVTEYGAVFWAPCFIAMVTIRQALRVHVSANRRRCRETKSNKSQMSRFSSFLLAWMIVYCFLHSFTWHRTEALLIEWCVLVVSPCWGLNCIPLQIPMWSYVKMGSLQRYSS